MTHRLNMMRIEKVRRGAENSGWFTMTVDEFAQHEVHDFGDRMEIDIDGHTFRVAALDGETVHLRKVS